MPPSVPMITGIAEAADHFRHWRGAPTKVAAIALANKLVRMAWAMMATNEQYKEPAALAA